jgi:hypothetical protein
VGVAGCLDNLAARLRRRWLAMAGVIVEPEIFVAQALLQDTPLDPPIREISDDFREITNHLLSEVQARLSGSRKTPNHCPVRCTAQTTSGPPYRPSRPCTSTLQLDARRR